MNRFLFCSQTNTRLSDYSKCADRPTCPEPYVVSGTIKEMRRTIIRRLNVGLDVDRQCSVIVSANVVAESEVAVYRDDLSDPHRIRERTTNGEKPNEDLRSSIVMHCSTLDFTELGWRKHYLLNHLGTQ